MRNKRYVRYGRYYFFKRRRPSVSNGFFLDKTRKIWRCRLRVRRHLCRFLSVCGPSAIKSRQKGGREFRRKYCFNDCRYCRQCPFFQLRLKYS